MSAPAKRQHEDVVVATAAAGTGKVVEEKHGGLVMMEASAFGRGEARPAKVARHDDRVAEGSGEKVELFGSGGAYKHGGAVEAAVGEGNSVKEALQVQGLKIKVRDYGGADGKSDRDPARIDLERKASGVDAAKESSGNKENVEDHVAQQHHHGGSGWDVGQELANDNRGDGNPEGLRKRSPREGEGKAIVKDVDVKRGDPREKEKEKEIKEEKQIERTEDVVPGVQYQLPPQPQPHLDVTSEEDNEKDERERERSERERERDRERDKERDEEGEGEKSNKRVREQEKDCDMDMEGASGDKDKDAARGYGVQQRKRMLRARGPTHPANRDSRSRFRPKDNEGTQERSLSKAKELFSDILNAGLLRGRVVSTEGRDLIRWICEETTKDALSGETLLDLLAEEKKRLHKALIEDRKNLAVVKPPHFWQIKYSPNLARLHSEIADTPKVCSKGDRIDALQRNLSGRCSSDAHGASESWPSHAQMARQRSESARDVLTCALCTRKFMEMPSLGRHWKEDHKKEAFLFQKGMACSECGHEYTNKGGLLRHWKSTHPTLPIGDFLIVCMMCDAKFMDFHFLWMHVEAQHSLEFSSAEFAQQVKKGVLGATVEDQNESAQEVPVPGPSSSRLEARFKCRFCGQRFNLLPDLGRHHQAEHGTKPKNKLLSPCADVKLPPLAKRTPLPHLEAASSPPGKMLPLADVFAARSSVAQDDPRNSVEWPEPNAQPQAFNFRHLKTIAREKKNKEEQIMNATPAQLPVPPPALQSDTVIAPQVIAPKKRRRRRKKIESLPNEMLVPGLVPMKKRLGRPPKRIVEHMRAIQQERYGASKMPLQRATNTNGLPSSAEKVLNTTGWPTSAEILDAARVACCKESWYRELGKKHSYVHPDLHLQAMSLFAVMRPDIQWLVDTFRCPNQCLPFHVVHAPTPALEVDMAGFSQAPSKAEADVLHVDIDHVTDTGSRPSPRAAPEAVDINLRVKGKVYVMNKDLSNGQEPVPIPCVIDEEVLLPCSCPQCIENMKNPSLDISEPWKCFRYTNRRLLDPSLGLDTESSKLGCACGEGKCNPSKCDHVVMFDHDNEEACDKSGVAMKGRFPYDELGRIIIEEGLMVYECNSSCSCREDCQNRILQKGVRVKLEVFKSRHKGWAVRTAEPIRSGTFVCEYIGEVINDREANRRGVRYDSEGCSYLYDIDAHLDFVVSRAGAKPFVIDATNHGNVARFINHSCAPNLINYEVLVESMDCQLAHIGFFARRDIGAGEELAYDYRYRLLPGKGATCHCGASTCRGRLY